MTQTMIETRYNELIEEIKKHIRYYDLALCNNKYCLGLANGDNINLTFPQNSIAHLLGIDIEELRRANLISLNTSSYDTLKKLTEYDLTYYTMQHVNNNFDVGSIFSNYVDSKIEIFNDILKVRTDDMYCIIKYVSERSYATGEEKENSDYFIIRKHDKKYSVLGICKDKEKDNNYVPVTSRLFENYDKLYEFLEKCAKHQEVTYPYSFQIENYSSVEPYSKRFLTTLNDKFEFNKTLRDMELKFKAIPSTSKDFLTIISRSLNNQQKSSNNSSIITMIKDDIASRNIIDKEEIKQMLDDSEIPADLELLINACNDVICSNSFNEESVNNSYSSIQNENSSLKEELQKAKEGLLALKEENEKLKNENNSLNKENESNKQKLKIFTDAYDAYQNIK